MIRRAPRRAVTALVSTVIAGGAGLAAAPAALAGWGKTFTLGPSGKHDTSPPVLTFSSSGAAAAVFSTSDVDVPGSQRAYLATRTGAGRVGAARRLSGAAQVLAVAYRGTAPQLLVGSTPADLDCCSAASTVAVSSSGSPGAQRRLVSGLAGATSGRLLSLAGGRMLAAVATERGVWVSQSGTDGRIGRAGLISTKGQEPTTMDAAWLGGSKSIVAWVGGTGVAGELAPRSIDIAEGSVSGRPRRARVELTVPRGHRVDELAVARRGAGASLVWIESWSDRRGAHSRVEIADLTGKRPRARPLSADNRRASDLSVAADPSGDQGVAWLSCTTNAACTAQAAGRPAGHGFGSAKALGPADATEGPSLAIADSGQVVVGFIRGGHPDASVGFGKPVQLTTAGDASGITVAYGSHRQALAAWTQGTLRPSVTGAAYSAR